MSHHTLYAGVIHRENALSHYTKTSGYTMLPECVCERRWREEDSSSRVDGVGEGWSMIVEGVAGGPAKRQPKAVNVHELQRNNHCHT